MRTRSKPFYRDQRGIVSIVVTMVMIIVMTLVVLGMSRNAVREQRQALDRQLSDQAFYNAESGINDWANYLYLTPGAQDSKNDCNAPSGPGFPSTPSVPVPSNVINTSTGKNNYPCVLYNKSPDSIIFDELSQSDPKVMQLSSSNGISSLTFKWENALGASIVNGCNFSDANALPRDLPANCNVGGIRLDLVDPFGNRDNLRQNNFVAFLLPSSSSGGTFAYTSGRGPDANMANQGAIAISRCTVDSCTLTINNIPLTGTNSLFMSVRSLYSTNKLTITGIDASGGVVRFKNAQIMLDVTGKSQDVLRRVQVRLPAANQYDYPGFALRTADSICKLITVNRDATPSPTATIDPACL